jgi:4-aminobutyrate aminotransferase-like enzyme
VLTGPPAAVIIEPFQGAGGMIPQPREFLEKLRDFCDRTDALLVFDEILSGVGRTGRMWAFEHADVVPDLLLLGKGLGAGYPIGIVAGRHEVVDAGPGALPTHNSSTFGGGPLACAVGLACLQILDEDRLVANAAEVGDYALERLHHRLDGNPRVGDIRGLGLAIGVELVEDRATLAPLGPAGAQGVLTSMLRRGVVISSSSHVVRITPPLCIDREQLDAIIDSLAAAIHELPDA